MADHAVGPDDAGGRPIILHITWWKDWRWWMAVSFALAMVSVMIFGAVTIVSKYEDRSRLEALELGQKRTKYENACRSRRAARLTLPQADETSATGRALVIALAGEDPEVARLVRKYVAVVGEEDPTTLDAMYSEIEKLLIAANQVDDARAEREDAENACAIEAIDRYPD